MAAIDYSLFDFEGQIESAVKCVCQTWGITVLIPIDDSEQYKKRPRVDCVFKVSGAAAHGPSGQRFIDTSFGPPILRDLAYNGELHLTIVTDSQEAAKVAYETYKAQMRFLVPMLPFFCNGKTLNNITLNFVRDVGATPVFKTGTEGDWHVGLVYPVDFSINTAALKALLATVISQGLNKQ